MAYNPNDCAELRWAGYDNSEEVSTCRRRAPQAQRAKMSSEYRVWFRERHWPGEDVAVREFRKRAKDRIGGRF